MNFENLLLPTDFSNTSLRAIQYAITLANATQTKNILLLHVYTGNKLSNNSTPLGASATSLLQEKQIQLELLKEKLMLSLDNPIPISTLLVEGKLIPIIHDIIKTKQIDLLLMSISSKEKLEQAIIGSNTWNVMRKTTCPTLIVPENAVWKDNPTIVAAIDISHDFRLLPIENIKSVVQKFQAQKLYLVNVENGGDHNAHIQNPNIDHLNFSFRDNKTQLDIVSSFHKLDAIEGYCKDKNASILVLFERKYGILETIFHRSLTRQLANKMHLPILVMEELTSNN